MERGGSPDEGSIVDMLLADVRSGFCNRKYGEGNFNITKVQKIHLDPNGLAAALSSGTGDALSAHDAAAVKPASPAAEGAADAKDFVRGGYGRVSLRKKRLENAESSSSSSSAAARPSSSDPPSVDTSSDSIGSDSLTQKRSRKSYATEDDASLIEFLMGSDLEKDAPKPEAHFDRYASLRRRRQERREKRNLLDVVAGERERAPSPVINCEGKISAPSTPTEGPLREAGGSAGLQTHSGSRALRRTRSWLDRPSVDKALAATTTAASPGTTTTAVVEDETDALVARIKSRLRGDKEPREPRSTPPIHEESPPPPRRAPSPSSAHHGDDTPRSRSETSRWRSSVTNGSDHHHLATIAEKDIAASKKNPVEGLQGVKTVPSESAVLPTEAVPSGSPAKSDYAPDSESNLEKIRRQMKQRYSSNVDTAQLSKLLNGDEEAAEKALRTRDDSDLSVTVSMRKAMSDKIGTNLDGLLKTIEYSHRPIDNFGVISPSKRQQPTETVAAMVAEESKRPTTPVGGEPPELKQKREKRKKRSTLDMAEVRTALRGISPSPAGQTAVAENKLTPDPTTPKEQQQQQQQQQQSPTLPPKSPNGSLKTPPSHRRTLSNGDKSPETAAEKGSKLNKDDKVAAKQAAKKNFRDARFGYKDMKSVAEINGRCRSDVEKQDVDQALRDLVNKGNMSRSKSYDESVARRASSEGEATMRSKSGSNPDTSEEKRSLLRGSRDSTNRLSMDGRRNGLYIPSDESDTELTPEDKSGSSRRPSSAKSDSPKSVSRLSIKSTNTSTETLQAEKDSDGDSSPEQRRRSYVRADGDVPEHSSTLTPSSTRPSSASSSGEGDRATRWTQSLLDRTAAESAITRLQSKVEQLDEDSPMASMAKWRLKRSKRFSAYDNVSDSDSGSLSPRNRSQSEHSGPAHLLAQRPDALDYKNEVGSRSSYASSYASSTDTDQGFESMGTVSQRTSLSSTLESEIAVSGGTPTLGRRAESLQQRGSSKRDSGLSDKSGDAVIVNSALSEEDSRKQRTETWTEQALRVTAGQGSPISSSSCAGSNALSPDSGHSTSKEEDLWSEGGSPTHSKGPAPLPPGHHPADSTPQSSRSTTPSETAKTKARPVPSYMRSTNSSARSRMATTPAATAAATAETDSGFKRDAASRKSFRGKESTLKRDSTVRASMRAESAFKRDASARTSVRGVRSSVRGSSGSAAPSSSSSSSSSPSSSSVGKTLMPPASRARADSNASAVSSVSATSDVSSASASKGVTSARRLTAAAGAGDVSRPTTPSARSTPRATTPSKGLTRTQSMRVTSTRTSPATNKRVSAPLAQESKRSVTPLSHEAKRPGTPSSDHSGSSSSTTSRRRSHFMDPTASYKAHLDSSTDDTPKAPPRAKSRFMEPTAASRAHKDSASPATAAAASSPTPPPRAKSAGGREGNVLGSLTRHGSLRMSKTSPRLTSSELSKGEGGVTKSGSGPSKLSSSSKKVAPADVDHHLATVTENVGAEEKETSADKDKSSSSLLKRIGIVKGKDKTSSTTPTKKTVIVSSAQARTGQDKKK